MSPQRLYRRGQKRVWGVFLLMAVGLFLVIGRLYKLQVLQYSFFKEKVATQIQKTFVLPAKRGNILDRNGLLLATTVDTYTISADPMLVLDKYGTAKNLAEILGLNMQKVKAKLSQKSRYALIKRRVNDHEVDQLKQAELRGVFFQKEQKRIYLRDRLASQVVGFVDLENKGKGGVELAFNEYLEGVAGSLVVDKDLIGGEIYSGNKIINPPQDGNSIELTIDEFLQYISKKELKKILDKYHADGGTVVVMDVVTGEILAMVSLPDYDPNRYYSFPAYCRRNDAVQSVYEPGSVFKLITVAAGLDKDIVASDSTFINGNSFEYGSRVIREAHPIKNPQSIRNVVNIIVESLNIGAAKLGLKIGKENLYDQIKKFNFGNKTGISLPGESSGIVKQPSDWAESDEAIIPFGQSIAATPLQMVCAVNAIANDGFYVKPKIVRRIIDNKGYVIKSFIDEIIAKRVISTKTSNELRKMMHLTVEEGTGFSARVAGYAIGGKTGTSQKPDFKSGGYKKGEYWGSFVGVVPVDRPRISILVVVNNPKGRYYGSAVAAPVFKNIAQEAVRYLSIVPNI